MTDDIAPVATPGDTYEHWTGPIRCVVRRGGAKIPLAPPLPGETEPFMWTSTPDEVVSMDLDGRPVESATFMVEDGRGKLVVKFKDGEQETRDGGPIRSTHDHP